jgi:hypothetical protein
MWSSSVGVEVADETAPWSVPVGAGGADDDDEEEGGEGESESAFGALAAEVMEEGTLADSQQNAAAAPGLCA